MSDGAEKVGSTRETPSLFFDEVVERIASEKNKGADWVRAAKGLTDLRSEMGRKEEELVFEDAQEAYERYGALIEGRAKQVLKGSGGEDDGVIDLRKLRKQRKAEREAAKNGNEGGNNDGQIKDTETEADEQEAKMSGIKPLLEISYPLSSNQTIKQTNSPSGSNKTNSSVGMATIGGIRAVGGVQVESDTGIFSAGVILAWHAKYGQKDVPIGGGFTKSKSSSLHTINIGLQLDYLFSIGGGAYLGPVASFEFVRPVSDSLSVGMQSAFGEDGYNPMKVGANSWMLTVGAKFMYKMTELVSLIVQASYARMAYEDSKDGSHIVHVSGNENAFFGVVGVRFF